MTTDEIDQALLAALRENARASTADLARRLNRSRTTVQSRIERLERAGIILGYTTRLAEPREAAVRAHVMVKIAPKQSVAVEKAMRALSAVQALHAVSGEFDLVAIAEAETVAALDAAIDQIGAIPGVERTNSAIVLATKFQR